MAAVPCTCCGTPCCPGQATPGVLCATVSSGCAVLNATLRLTLIQAVNAICWAGEVDVSGCFQCTKLFVSVCCQLNHSTLLWEWSIGWHLERPDGIVCVVFALDTSVTTLTYDCGPPLNVTLVSTHLNLTDPGPGTPSGLCCSDFTVTIVVTPCSGS